MAMKAWRVVTQAIMMAAVAAMAGSAACQRPKSRVEHYEPVANYARDVTWLKADGAEVKADVSWPEGPGPFPVVVWFHGGGWRFFSKSANEGLARYLTNRGFVVMNMDYRMAPAVKMKTIIEDAQGAVVWAKDHANEYHGDPARLAVGGHSAGAHLAAMAAMACGDPFFTPSYPSAQGNDCQVAAIVPVSAVFDFEGFTEREASVPRIEEIFGATPQQDPDLYRRCSPLAYIRPDLPPQLVVYAGKENLRPRIERYLARLQPSGAPYQVYMQPKVNHIWVIQSDTEPAHQTYDRIIAFLNETLKAK
jgi:acetyl esterase/lipase